MGAALSHQIGQEEYVILSKLLYLDVLLLAAVILCAQYFVHPPFIAGRRAEHTAHQMVVSVRVGEGMKGVVLIHAEFLAGNENRARGSKGNIAGPVSDGSRSHGCRRVVPGSRRDFYVLRQAEPFCKLRLQSADRLIALKNLRQLVFLHAADFHHFL